MNLLDIELLTIKIRLVVASVDRAREMGINWWEYDPSLTSPPLRDVHQPSPGTPDGDPAGPHDAPRPLRADQTPRRPLRQPDQRAPDILGR